MRNSLEEKTWKTLIDRINGVGNGKCTPFLGAGTCHGLLPLGGEVARKWAAEYKYPFPDSSDLVKVAQYVALNHDSMVPKEEILKILAEEGKAPDFKNPLQPHRALADLPLPIYLTTNYDNLMTEALQYRRRDPKREICRWNKLVEKCPSVFKGKSKFQPTVANPVVFHLHGHSEFPESLVLTEDDYMDFLVNLSRPALMPPAIQAALEKTTLLFLGYRMADWSFRVLMRGISRLMEPSMRRMNVAVMLPPAEDEVSSSDSAETSQQKAQDYLDKYYDNLGIQVYWGTVSEFFADLKKRMNDAEKAAAS